MKIVRKAKTLSENLETEIKEKVPKPVKDYSNLGLTHNPFPPAGIPREDRLFEPIGKNIDQNLHLFIRSTYLPERKEKGEYAGLTIVGDFGMGKTHIMKYLKRTIDKISSSEDVNFPSITAFVDRPEDDPRTIIHKIIEQIGEDNIRKYVWNIVIEKIIEEYEGKEEKFYKEYEIHANLFKTEKSLFAEPMRSVYLEFLSVFKQLKGDIKKLQEKVLHIIKDTIIPDDALAHRYLDLIFVQKEISRAWEALAGYASTREFQKKEVMFLRSVVNILRKQGYAQLYVFIDEFEDISKIRKEKLINYLTTLNILINNQSNWALIVSLNSAALKKIGTESAPLYDRLTSYKIELMPLDIKGAERIVLNYLNTARKDSSSLSPFKENTLKAILDISQGNYRSFILLCQKLVEYAADLGLKPPLKKELIQRIESFGRLPE